MNLILSALTLLGRIESIILGLPVLAVIRNNAGCAVASAPHGLSGLSFSLRT